ncbi:MAG: V-type ATP synthase subunit I [Planctomycetota bacterium]|jgi:V/A-type H+-transporting ATPase subunit I
MAIASMQKVMIVAHRSQAVTLLQALQEAGIVQILDAERAMVTKEWPELMVESKRHRSLEETIDRLSNAIDFLKPYSGKDPTSLFAPYIQVDAAKYDDVVTRQDTMTYLGEIEQVKSEIEKLTSEAENHNALLAKLSPWKTLSVPVEELGGLSTSTTFVGLVADQHYDAVCEKLTDLGAAIEKVDSANRMTACIVVCFNEVAGDAQKALRSAEFEVAAFEGLSGIVGDTIAQIQNRLEEIQAEQALLEKQSVDLAQSKLNLQILFDHLQNLHNRIHTESNAPATDYAVFLEGWVKKKQLPRLEKMVARFDACDVAPIQPGQDEEPPVEIENGPMSAPFETVTRLYGMPAVSDVDPTAFLAPFFALFFGICLTDAAYGLVMVGFLWWLNRKIKGGNKFVMMLIFCSIVTVVAGALTGGWCGDMIQKFAFFNGGTPDVADTVF